MDCRDRSRLTLLYCVTVGLANRVPAQVSICPAVSVAAAVAVPAGASNKGGENDADEFDHGCLKLLPDPSSCTVALR